jgi:CRISPR-associated protein Cmr2
MSQSLLIFTIGPVQGFIEEARRTHDLWAGSQILVELIRSAAQAARDTGATLIYPADLSQASLPNRFVAELDEAQASSITDAAEKAVNARWCDFANSALSRLQKLAPNTPGWQSQWGKQIENYFEVFWAMCDGVKNAEGTDGQADYQERYRLASAALGARKQTRDFDQFEQTGLKDSLSGARAALTTGPSAEDCRNFWQAIGENLRTRRGENPTLLRPDGRERLDAIGATKRFSKDFEESAKFPSVSSVAANGFRRRVVQAGGDAHTALVNYRGALSTLRDANDDGVFQPRHSFRNTGLADWPFDGDLLYRSTLTTEALQSDYHLVDVASADLDGLRRKLSKLYGAAKCRPSTYYAILVMDGDQMGRRVSQCESRDAHEALSHALTQFAERAMRIVEVDFAGRVVYAGGDDLLALLPLDDAVPAAFAVRREFMADDLKLGTTISAGMAIAHHQAPLSMALREARRAEQKAKRDGRDALCVAALKRSGEHVWLSARWDAMLTNGTKENMLHRVISLFSSTAAQQSQVSSKLAYDLKNESHVYVDGKQDAAYAARLGYLMGRHATRLDKAEQKILTGQLQQLAGVLGAEALANWLLLARFIAQGGADE